MMSIVKPCSLSAGNHDLGTETHDKALALTHAVVSKLDPASKSRLAKYLN